MGTVSSSTRESYLSDSSSVVEEAYGVNKKMFKQYKVLSRQTKIYQQYTPEQLRVAFLSIYWIGYHQYAHITVYPENDPNNRVWVWMEMHMDGPCVRVHTREHHQQCQNRICGRYEGQHVIILRGDQLRDALTLWHLWDGLDQTKPYHFTKYNCTHYATELVRIALNTRNYRLITGTLRRTSMFDVLAYYIYKGESGNFVYVSQIKLVPIAKKISN